MPPPLQAAGARARPTRGPSVVVPQRPLSGNPTPPVEESGPRAYGHPVWHSACRRSKRSLFRSIRSSRTSTPAVMVPRHPTGSAGVVVTDVQCVCGF